MLDEEKTSNHDMVPKWPDRMANMVVAKCVQNRWLNAFSLSWCCLVHISYRFMN